jgi:hypothetical protein
MILQMLRLSRTIATLSQLSDDPDDYVIRELQQIYSVMGEDYTNLMSEMIAIHY